MKFLERLKKPSPYIRFKTATLNGWLDWLEKEAAAFAKGIPDIQEAVYVK